MELRQELDNEGQAPVSEADPLVADLRAIETSPRDSRSAKQRLVAVLGVLPTLSVTSSYLATTADDPTAVCESIDRLLRIAISHLTEEADVEAATYLMRLDPGSATKPIATLFRLAAEVYPGRNSKNRLETRDAPRMRPASFIKSGRKHDTLLRSIAHVIRELDGQSMTSTETMAKVMAQPVHEDHPATPLTPSAYCLEVTLLSSKLTARIGYSTYKHAANHVRTKVSDGTRTELIDERTIVVFSPDYCDGDAGCTSVRLDLATPNSLDVLRLNVIGGGLHSPHPEPCTGRNRPKRKPPSVGPFHLALELRLVFKTADPPPQVWYYERTPSYDNPPDFSKSRQIEADKRGHFVCTFREIQERIVLGLAWRSPDQMGEV